MNDPLQPETPPHRALTQCERLHRLLWSSLALLLAAGLGSSWVFQAWVWALEPSCKF